MTKENCTETDGMSPNNFLLLDSEINEPPEATEETKVVFGSCDYKGVWSCQRPLLWKERGTHYNMSYKMANYWNPSPSNYKTIYKGLATTVLLPSISIETPRYAHWNSIEKQQHFLCAGNSAKKFTRVISSNPCFCKGGCWCFESDLDQITQVVKNRVAQW